MNKRISFSLLAALVIAVMIGVGVFYSGDKFFVDDDKPPVVEKMIGEYRFAVSDRVFLVPRGYVKSYGVKKTDGALDSFTVRLPVLNGVGEAEVIISSDRRSKEAMEKYWYSNVYQYYRERLSGWKENVSQEGGELAVVGERSFLVKGDRVSRMLRCKRRICSVFVAYSDKLGLYIVFDKKLRRNWLDLTAQVVQEITYFEQSGRAIGR